MGKSSVLGALLAFVLVTDAAGQIDTERVAPEQDLRDLYGRAAASRFVVVGTVVKSDGGGKRLSASDRKKMIQPGPDNKTVTLSLAAFAGSLFIVNVEQTLCRQSDFYIGAAASSRTPEGPAQTVHLFIPREEPLWVDGHRQEILLEGQRYLLFLVEADHSSQKEWTNSFELGRNRTYYRAEERNRGVVPLLQPTPNGPAPKQPPLLEKVTRLCEAVRPADRAYKLAGLKKLAESGDPVLKKAAEAAARALQTHPTPREN